MTLGVILAGGQARRMGGGDKGRLMLGDQSLFARVIERLDPQVDGLVLNANGDTSRLDDLGLPVVSDSQSGFAGPLAGVLAGLDYAATQGASEIVTAAADTPFFPTDLVVRLNAMASATGVALAATREGETTWPQPTFGLWPVALRDDLRAALAGGLRKVLHWTDRHDAGYAIWSSKPHDPFFNINTPEDLAIAETRLAEPLP